MEDEEIRKTVREHYAEIAVEGRPASFASTASVVSCCAPQEATSVASCCPPQETASKAVGYTDNELGAIPEGANLGLGCGNPTELASLKEGEVVLDLGSGGGVDCFIAANKVGDKGKAIGVDMTSEMISRARENTKIGNYSNVEFRLGEIENLPVADNFVDVVISNCVINLSPDKGRVFRESFRVLKPGGRLMVSDIVLLKELPESIRNDMAAWVGCIAGASQKEEYLSSVANAGFEEVEIVSESSLGRGDLVGSIASVNVSAVKTR